jgi:hypothetical protein
VLFPIKKILNIDKYFVYESRDMSDESDTYIILLKLKKCIVGLKFKVWAYVADVKFASFKALRGL